MRGVGLDDPHPRFMGPALPSLFQQRGTQVNEFNSIKPRQLCAKMPGVVAGAGAEFDDQRAVRRCQHFDQFGSSLQQPIAESIVGFRLRTIKTLQTIGVVFACGCAAGKSPQGVEIGRDRGFHAFPFRDERQRYGIRRRYAHDPLASAGSRVQDERSAVPAGCGYARRRVR